MQVAELTAQGLVRESEGAMCFFMPDKAIPLMLRKSDGGFTYDTTDMAAYVPPVPPVPPRCARG
jgi:arginyl-tRNA synthetase